MLYLRVNIIQHQSLAYHLHCLITAAQQAADQSQVLKHCTIADMHQEIVNIEITLCGFLCSLDSSDSERLCAQASTNTDLHINSNTSNDLGFPTFPAGNSEEGIYYEKVLLAVKRWFSFFGWPGAPHPISVPHTLRRYLRDSLPLKQSFTETVCDRCLLSPFRVISKTLVHSASGQSQRVTLNRDTRCVLDPWLFLICLLNPVEIFSLDLSWICFST